MSDVQGACYPFPNLTPDNYRITSPSTPLYNCIAWAAGDDTKWWWPTAEPRGSFWPAGVPRHETAASFQAAFEQSGYSLCADDSHDPALEKIAIYFSDKGLPTHAARQLPNGNWTSKLGQNVDIVHSDLDAIQGPEYGIAMLIMSRPRLHT